MRDGKSIYSGWHDGKIRSFLPQSGKLIYCINEAHTNGVTAITATSDCQKIVSGGMNGEIRVWKISTYAQKMETSLKEHRSRVWNIIINSKNDRAISASADGSCIEWDINNYTRIACMFETTMFKQLIYHPDESQILTTGTNKKITYWDLNDLPINTRQYENSIDNDVLTAIYAVADELYRNNNQLNCNLNMNKKLIRLTESDLHRIVKQSVSKILKESSYDSMGNFNKESNNSDVRERLTDEITKISQEMSRSMSTIDGVAKRAVGDEEITNRARIVINALIDACRKMRNITQLIGANRWDLQA
jgi:WD40 repeat protein